MLALNRLPELAHKIEFLTVNDRIQEAIRVLQLEGKNYWEGHKRR